jgi:ABC-2 type transport system permease protein
MMATHQPENPASQSARNQPMMRQGLNFRRLRALIWKEGIQIINDPSSILIALVLPVVLLFLFGYAVSLDSTRLRVGIALAEQSPESASLVAALSSSKYFDVQTSLDRRALETDLVAGRLRGVIVIPSDFSQNLIRPGEEPTIQVIADGSEPNTANFVQNYVLAAVNIWAQERGMETGNGSPSLIDLQARVWFNPSLESKNYLVPGSIAIVLTMIATLLTALVVAREWEHGTMEALMAIPVRIEELILGKLIPYFGLGIGSMAFCTVVALSIFRVPLRGSFVTLTSITTVFLLGGLGIGLLVSTLTKSQFVASQIAVVLGFLPAFQLSGFLFEISSMPPPIQWLTYLFPARYYVQALQTTFLAGDVPYLVVTNGVILFGFAALFFLLNARMTRKRLD